MHIVEHRTEIMDVFDRLGGENPVEGSVRKTESTDVAEQRGDWQQVTTLAHAVEALRHAVNHRRENVGGDNLVITDQAQTDRVPADAAPHFKNALAVEIAQFAKMPGSPEPQVEMPGIGDVTAI